jgi:putative spermidine/putrescine transport system ATP-binding protein
VFSVRPEKIHLGSTDQPVAEGEHCADGTVAEVVYVGDATRFVVDLDAGGRLVALQQNIHRTSSDVQGMRGERVRLVWRRDHEYKVG